MISRRLLFANPTWRLKVNWFDGFGELFFEGVVKVGVFTPLTKVFRMLPNGFADLCCSAGWYWDDRLRPWIIYDGKWLSRGHGVVHEGRHDEAKISVGAATSVGGYRGRILFQGVAKVG
jgi:hypothetical protein